MGKHIDPHVHCRDWDESGKSTIREVMDIAKSHGFVAIFDMPNTKPPITTRELVERRLKTAEDEGCLDGYYLYVGATNDPKQIIEAASIVESNPKVVGIKLYAGKSVGGLAITEPSDQKMIFKTLADIGYTQPLVAHCELESMARPDLWVPEKPATWNLAKPPEMEVAAVRQLIGFAKETGYKGHLHICHTSTPEAVRIVDGERPTMRISCSATPHHLLYSTEDMQSTDGMRLKVNPPIRERSMMLELRELLKQGKIDWIETDHAPHRPEEKKYDPQKPKDFFMSGIRSLDGFTDFLQKMKGIGLTDRQIDSLTYYNIKNVFKKVKE